MRWRDTTTMVEALAAASVRSGSPGAADVGVVRTTDPAVRKLQEKDPEFPKYDWNPEHYLAWFVAVENMKEIRQLWDQAAIIFATEALEKFCQQTVEYNVLHTLQSLMVQGENFPFYVNQYALGNKLMNNSRKVRPNTIRTAFLFVLELEMQVELLKLDKNDEIDTLEQCIAAAWEIH